MTNIKRGVLFGDKHTYNDYGFFLNSYPVSTPPEPYTNLVDIPGMDGQLNLSTSLDGFMHYKTRKLDVNVVYIGDREDWPAVCREIISDIHGKELDIRLDDDPGYTYHGLVTVGTPKYKRHDLILPITAKCDAYKYEDANSVEDWLWDNFSFDNGVIREYGNLRVDGSLDVELIGCERPCYPDFVVKSDDGKGLTMIYEGVENELDDGTNIIAGFAITRDMYNVRFVGNGTVSIVFECGVL